MNEFCYYLNQDTNLIEVVTRDDPMKASTDWKCESQRYVDLMNQKLGLTPDQVDDIIISSVTMSNLIDRFIGACVSIASDRAPAQVKSDAIDFIKTTYNERKEAEQDDLTATLHLMVSTGNTDPMELNDKFIHLQLFDIAAANGVVRYLNRRC